MIVDGWRSTSIDESCNIEYGTRVVHKRDGGAVYPVYGGGGATFFMDTANRESRIVISRFGMSAECTRFVNGKFFLNDSGLTLSPKNLKELLPAFLDKFVLAINDQIFELGKGSAQKNLDVPAFRVQRIAYPTSMVEQQRIVAILDEAFGGIATAKANAEKNLLNARTLFKSYRQSVLSQRGEGWLDRSLGELCDIKHGFAFKSEFFVESGRYVLLTPGNFYESGGYRDRGEKQKYYAGEIPKGFVLAEGDLLVAMTEQAAGLLGSSILVPESGKFLHNQRLGLVTHKPGVPWTNEYFFHVFNTEAIRHAIHASATGVKVRHTSPTKIGEVKVSFPSSTSKQLDLVARLLEFEQETQRLESIYQQKLTALDELKKSLLHQAFSGAL